MRWRKSVLISIILVTLFMNFSYAERINYNTAFELFQNHLYFLAHKNFQDVIKYSISDNEIEDSYYYSALSSYYLKQYKRAIIEFRKLLLNFPETVFKPKVKFYISLSYYYTKNYVGAIQHLRDFLQQYPDSEFKIDSYIYIGKSYFHLKYIDSAVETLKNIINEYPNNEKIPEVKFELAKVYFANKEYNKSIEIFKSIDKDYPQFKSLSEIKLYIAENYRNLGDINNALYIYKEIYNTTSPYRKFAIFNIAVIYFNNNSLDESKKHFLEFIEKYSDDIDLMDDVYYFLGTVFYKTDDTYLAAKYFDLLLKKFPKSPWIENCLLLYSKIVYNNGKQLDAVNYLKQGVKISKNHKDIFLKKLSDIYIEIYDYDKAKVSLLDLIETTTSSRLLKEAYFNLVNIYLKENNLDKGIKYLMEIYRQGLKDKIYYYALFKLGKIYLQKKEYDRSLLFLEKLEGTDYFTNEVNLYKVKIFFNQEKYGDVLNLLDKVKNLDTELIYMKAVSFLNLSSIEQAVKLFQTIVENNPENKVALKSFNILVDIQKSEDEKRFILNNAKIITKYHNLDKKHSDKILKMMAEEK